MLRKEWKDHIQNIYAVSLGSAFGLAIGYGLSVVFLGVITLIVTGCAPLLGENKQTELVSIERYDPETGRPMKVAEIIDDRPIKVKFTGPDGKPIIKLLKLTGGMYTPPPLPAVKESLKTEAEKPK